MKANSRRIDSNQEGKHPDLQELVTKLASSEWKGPMHPPTLGAFEKVQVLLEKWKTEETPWILDSGCGVGASTYQLSQQFPDHQILGVDRSEVRLSKTSGDHQDPLFQLKDETDISRIHYLRAELSDFWRLILKHNLLPDRHFILYPNPYPKKIHLKKRFHGSISLQDILRISPKLELRSNWPIYLEEFCEAAGICAQELDNLTSEVIKTFTHGKLKILNLTPQNCMTHFEKKYCLSEQELFQLQFGE